MNDENSGRVLLIDDDEVFLHVLGRALGARGFEVTSAKDGAEALARCVDFQPRFIVLDLKLGSESGLALIPLLGRKRLSAPAA